MRKIGFFLKDVGQAFIFVCGIFLLMYFFKFFDEMIINKFPEIVKIDSYFGDFVQSLTSTGSLLIIILTYYQFVLFNKEYKIRHQSKVIPYIEVVKDGYCSARVFIQLYNESNVVAKNIGMTINEEWLDNLSESERKHTDIITEVGKRKNLYITNKQEHSYFLGYINEKERIDKGIIIITITYYSEHLKEKDYRKESFEIDLSNILLKKDHMLLKSNIEKRLKIN